MLIGLVHDVGIGASPGRDAGRTVDELTSRLHAAMPAAGARQPRLLTGPALEGLASTLAPGGTCLRALV